MNGISMSIAVGAVVIAGLSAYGLHQRLAEQEAALARLEEGLSSRGQPDDSPRAGAAELERMTGLLEGLAARVARLESAPRRTVVAAAARAEPEPARSEPSGEPDVDDARAAEASESDQAAELAALMAELLGPSYDWKGSTEELERFYELARGTDLIAERIEELEAAVDSNPADVERRMELADYYVAKLMTVQGAEQGLWGAKAEEQWREVAARDEDHWGANFSLGNNYAFYPDVMGKTDEAISFLERALEIQERSAQDDDHVRTYLSLARMYQRKGEKERAREVLEAGLLVHAPNPELEAALASLGG